jgi:hypothetical protein
MIKPYTHSRPQLRRVGLFVALFGVMSLVVPASLSEQVGSALLAKPKKSSKKRKRSSYDRRRRQAAALIKKGHPTVELSVRTSPRVAARVYHGKELLGTAPFTIKWPKDTGSLDLVLKASGYITVNTRLYTYRDDKVNVEMFKTSQAHKLFGYKKRVEPSSEREEGGE